MSVRLFAGRALAGCFSLLLATTTLAVDRSVPTATYPTITAAAAVAQPGDRILVGPGVYQEHVTTTVSNLQFIGRSAVWDGTLTNGTPGVCLTANADRIRVQGFTFRGGFQNAAQVQITGTNSSIIRCTSRGPGARFLRVVGTNTLVDSCTVFGVNSTAIELIGDGAIVRKLRARQCEDNVVYIEGSRAAVTSCSFNLNDDSASIRVEGNEARISLNKFVNCDTAIIVEGTNAVISKNTALYNDGTFISIEGPGATVTDNRATTGLGTCLSISGNGAIVERNRSSSGGAMSITGDNIVVRKNSVSDAPNERNGITVNSETETGGAIVEKNTVKEAAGHGIVLGCWNGIILGNRVTGAGSESGESGFNISGSGNRLTNNIATISGNHGFRVTGSSNILVKCTAIDAAADGFNISSLGNSLFICDAMLCTGEGLDNGGIGTFVIDSMFKRNRIDVANDGTFSNVDTFATDNEYNTGGPNQLPQID